VGDKGGARTRDGGAIEGEEVNGPSGLKRGWYKRVG